MKVGRIEFSPGPWRTELGDRSLYHFHERRLILGGLEGLTTIAKMPEGLNGESEANARLIAAAPELLDALKGLIGYVQLISGRSDFPDDLRQSTNHRFKDAVALVERLEPTAAKAEAGAL